MAVWNAIAMLAARARLRNECEMKRELLSEEALQTALASLPGWQLAGRELVREFRFDSYWAGIEFVNRVAKEAEALNHHPDLFVGWCQVNVRLTTHSAGGLTGLDATLAGTISAV
jgi:4a-hydroxytetrahydrobiopterin dehydratase